MYTVVITGGIGSGKSAVTDRLAQHGAWRIDLDDVAASVRDDEAIAEQIVDRFGDEVLDGQGGIDRRALAARVFASEQDTHDLGDIMNPAIVERVVDMLDEGCDGGSPDLEVCVIEVPVIGPGSPFIDLADEVVAVTAPVETRVARAVARGMDERDVRDRIALQITDEERVALADTVIDNSGSLDEVHAKADAWWDERAGEGWVGPNATEPLFDGADFAGASEEAV